MAVTRGKKNTRDHWERTSAQLPSRHNLLIIPWRDGAELYCSVSSRSLHQIMQKWCTHNLLWVQSVRKELGLLCLQSKRILTATSQSPCLFITHPPTLCCFAPSLRGYLSDLDLKMAASLEWVGMRTGMRERNFSMPNQPRKKCFHHFGLGWFSFLCCRVLATHCVKKLTFTASIAPITYCDRSKRLKWSPPSYLLLVVNFKVPQV